MIRKPRTNHGSGDPCHVGKSICASWCCVAIFSGSMSDIHSDISHDQHAVRRQKLAEMRAAGTDPFRASFATTHFSGDAIKSYVEGQDNAVNVSVAGRLVTMRDMGKSQFVKI